MRTFAVVVSIFLGLALTGCCDGPASVRIFFSAPGNAKDQVPWSDGLVLPPGFDLVVEYADGDELAGEAIEIYRELDGARVAVTPTTTGGVEDDASCAAHTHTVYALRELDNGNHTAVHRRAAGTGKAVEQDDMPAWSMWEGEEALLFTFCVWDNGGMISPCQ